MISFLNIKITTYYIDLGQPELTCQIHDSSYEIMITLQKVNQNKLLSLILNQPNIE
jgi:hypothetical protein